MLHNYYVSDKQYHPSHIFQFSLNSYLYTHIHIVLEQQHCVTPIFSGWWLISCEWENTHWHSLCSLVGLLYCWVCLCLISSCCFLYLIHLCSLTLLPMHIKTKPNKHFRVFYYCSSLPSGLQSAEICKRECKHHFLSYPVLWRTFSISYLIVVSLGEFEEDTP